MIMHPKEVLDPVLRLFLNMQLVPTVVCGTDSMEQKCTLLIYKMYEFTLKEPGVKFLSKNLATKFGLTLNAP